MALVFVFATKEFGLTNYTNGNARCQSKHRQEDNVSKNIIVFFV